MGKVSKDRAKKRVAVLRFSALGDVALTIPALYSACENNPDAEITVVTRRPLQGLFVNAPSNLRVAGADLKGEYKGIGGLKRLAESLDADTVVDLHDVIRTWIISAFARRQGKRTVKFDKARKAKRELTRHGALGWGRQVRHTIERYKDALREAGLETGGEFRGLFADKKADPALYSKVAGEKRAGEKWVGIAPFAAHAGKVYPAEQMLEVVHALNREPNTTVFLFGGGAEETSTLMEWSGDGANIVCVAGAGLGFAGELALMSELDAMVSMDSGNMHMGAIAGAPVIGIWGATHPAAGFTGWDMGDEDCIGVEMECRPCSVFGNKSCRRKDFACMREISAGRVLRAIKDKMNQREKDRQ